MEVPKSDFEMLSQFPAEIWTSLSYLLGVEHIGRLKMAGAKSLWRILTDNRSVKLITFKNGPLIPKSWPAFLNELAGVEELKIVAYSISYWKSMNLKLSLVPSKLKKLEIQCGRRTEENGEIHSFFLDENGNFLELARYTPLLEVLNLSIRWDKSYPWIAHPPPHLTALTADTWDCAIPLPPTLIQLTVKSISEHASAPYPFPPCLESLTVVHDLPSPLIPALPPSLTSLKSNNISDTLKLSECANLPRGLICLRKIFCEKSFREAPSILPISLPSNLTDLEISMLPCAYWALLPRTLVSLTLDPSVDCSIVSRTLFNPITSSAQEFKTIPFDLLPRTLTKLELAVDRMAYVDCDPLPNENTSSAFSSFFPPNLTLLSLVKAQLSVEAMKQLPLSLKLFGSSHLAVNTIKLLPRNMNDLLATVDTPYVDEISDMPPSLTSLRLARGEPRLSFYDPSTAIKRRLEDWKSNGLGIGESRKFDFPMTLTRLALKDFASLDDSFTERMIRRLQNLVELTLVGTSQLTNSSITMLPSSITHLSLQGASKITGKCFQDLPKTLKVLSLDTEAIEDSDIAHLPPCLEFLKLWKASFLTELCFKHLPRSIESLCILSPHIGLLTSSNLPFNARRELI